MIQKINLLNMVTLAATTPQFVTDTVRLANDAATWVIMITAAVGVSIAIYFFVKWGFSSENAKAVAWKRSWTAVAVTVGAGLVEGLIKLLLSYYIHTA